MNKQEIIKKFGENDKDTGSSNVQIAILTESINEITGHLKVHRKDHASRLGLMKKVGRRKRLLDYVKRHSMDNYKALIEALSIRK